jgi:hypothetical protein
MPPAALILDHPAILRATARQHYWEGIGTLSVKMFRYGRAFYQSGGGTYAVVITTSLRRILHNINLVPFLAS